MTRLKICLVFISLLAGRWASYPSPLPSSWARESVVGYTATIFDEPEYTDSKTIVRSGIWYIVLPGYTEIISGSRVRFEGVVEPKMILGKVTQIKMVDPKMEVIGKKVGLRTVLATWRKGWIDTLQKNLPEPMASLASGILLGVKGRMLRDFYDDLVNTGTLHIVAASGFNVSIVAAILMKGAMMVIGRGWAIGVGVMGIVVYVVIAGASASVVRAGIMGSLALIAYYFGRPAEARRLLWVTAFAMLLFNPLYMVDIGFQLSFMATAGLMYVEPWIKLLSSLVKSRDPSTAVGMTRETVGMTGKFLSDYLYPTLAATMATLPIIWWHFGRVSWISPLVNMLVLPVVPLIMLLSALTLVGGQLVAWIAYVPLWWIVAVIRWFG